MPTAKSKLVIAVRHNAACCNIYSRLGDINARRRAARGAWVIPELTESLQLCHPELISVTDLPDSIFLRSSRKALWSHPYGFAEEE